MTYLLDTHILLWLLGEPHRLPDSLIDELAHPDTRLLVSAASAMEVATKTRIGKLPIGEPLVAGWDERCAEIEADELPISAHHALLAGSLVWPHRDPFDRLLAAQAIIEGIPLVTNDPLLRAFEPVTTHW